MNYQEACAVFELGGEAAASDIRKQYLKLCLKYHPDKNQDSPESVSHFQKIQEAYLVLMDEDDAEGPDEDLDQESADITPYEALLAKMPKWLQPMIPSVLELSQHPIWSSLAKLLEQRVVSWAESLDKEVLLNIHGFMEKASSRGGANIPTILRDVFTKIVREKTAKDRHIALTPSLADVFAARVIRHVEIDECGLEHVYMIPSWVEESVFDWIGAEAAEIVFTCIPKCPDGCHIDEMRNVHFTVEASVVDLLGGGHPDGIFRVHPIEGCVLEVKIEDLYLRREQTVVFRGRGIPKIAAASAAAGGGDIFDVQKYGNVVVHLRLV